MRKGKNHIRKEWNAFYKNFEKVTPSKIINKRTEYMEKEIIIAVIAGLAGSIFTYFFAVKTLIKQKKLDLKTQFLIEAWIKLEDASNREDKTKFYLVEEAIAKIQLFGSKKQLNLSREFLENIRDKKGISLLPLLIDLRRDLRKELKLESVENEEYTSCRLK